MKWIGVWNIHPKPTSTMKDITWGSWPTSLWSGFPPPTSQNHPEDYARCHTESPLQAGWHRGRARVNQTASSNPFVWNPLWMVLHPITHTTHTPVAMILMVCVCSSSCFAFCSWQSGSIICNRSGNGGQPLPLGIQKWTILGWILKETTQGTTNKSYIFLNFT